MPFAPRHSSRIRQPSIRFPIRIPAITTMITTATTPITIGIPDGALSSRDRRRYSADLLDEASMKADVLRAVDLKADAADFPVADSTAEVDLQAEEEADFMAVALRVAEHPVEVSTVAAVTAAPIGKAVKFKAARNTKHPV